MDITSPTTSPKISADSVSGMRDESVPVPLKPDIKTPVLANGELGRVQELLFGKQLSLNSEQLASLQLYVDQHLALIRADYSRQLNDVNARFNSLASDLEHKLQKYESVVGKRLLSEQESHRLSQSALSEQLKNTSNRISTMQEHLGTQMNEVEKRLNDNMQSNAEEIRQRVDVAMNNLGEQKLDRGALSELLNDVAAQLSKQSVAGRSGDRVESGTSKTTPINNPELG